MLDMLITGSAARAIPVPGSSVKAVGYYQKLAQHSEPYAILCIAPVGKDAVGVLCSVAPRGRVRISRESTSLPFSNVPPISPCMIDLDSHHKPVSFLLAIYVRI